MLDAFETLADAADVFPVRILLFPLVILSSIFPRWIVNMFI